MTFDDIAFDQACCGGGHKVAEVKTVDGWARIKVHRTTGEITVRKFSPDKRLETFAGPMTADEVSAILA